MNLRADRSRIVVGVSLGLLAAFVLSVLSYLWLLRQSYVGEIEAVQPRTARLIGMVQTQERLIEAEAAAQRVMTDISHPSEGDRAAVAAAMQREVRELMTEAGLSVTGSQVLDARSGEGYDQLRLDITAEGNINALDEALTQLEQLQPLIFVEKLKVKPVRNRRRAATGDAMQTGDPRKLNARFSLFALRLQQ